VDTTGNEVNTWTPQGKKVNPWTPQGNKVNMWTPQGNELTQQPIIAERRTLCANQE
jgi:hypothetical protein